MRRSRAASSHDIGAHFDGNSHVPRWPKTQKCLCIDRLYSNCPAEYHAAQYSWLCWAMGGGSAMFTFFLLPFHTSTLHYLYFISTLGNIKIISFIPVLSLSAGYCIKLAISHGCLSEDWKTQGIAAARFQHCPYQERVHERSNHRGQMDRKKNSF